MTFAAIFKANPYHDATGRFAEKGGAIFVSIGGLFDRQRAAATARQASSPPPAAKAPEPRSQAAEGLTTTALREPLSPANFRLGIASVLDRTMHPEDVNSLYDMSQGRLDPNKMAEALGGSTTTKFNSMRVNKAREILTVELEGEMHGARINGACIRSFNFDTKDVHHDYLKITNADQGGGAVRKMFKAVIPEYQRIGMKSVSVFANIDMGSHAWAKYGFTPNNPREYAASFDSGAKTIMTAFHRMFPSSSLTDEAKGELRGVIETLTKLKDSKYVAHAMSDLRTPLLDKELADVYKTMFYRTDYTGLTFAKTSMIGRGWDGTLKFDDKPSMDRMAAYVTR